MQNLKEFNNGQNTEVKFKKFQSQQQQNNWQLCDIDAGIDKNRFSF